MIQMIEHTTSYFALKASMNLATSTRAETDSVKAKEAQPKQAPVYQQLAGYYQRQGNSRSDRG